MRTSRGKKTRGRDVPVFEPLPEDTKQQTLQTIREQPDGQSAPKERRDAFEVDNLFGGGNWLQCQPFRAFLGSSACLT